MVDHLDVVAAAEAVVAVLPEDAAVAVAASVADVAADAVVDGEFGLIPMQLSQDILLSLPILMSGSVDSQISFTLG